MEDELELQVIEQTLSSFWHYTDYAIQEIYHPRKCKWDATSKYQQALIPWYNAYLDQLKQCIESNGIFYREIVAYAVQECQITPNSNIDSWKQPSPLDFSKTVLMLNQIYREWSEDSQGERSFLLNKVAKYIQGGYNLKILNPGVGTGRLVADIVKNLHVSCEGNDNSYHMIIISMYLMNKGLKKDQITIYPFIHGFSHLEDTNDQLKPINIPDLELSISPNDSAHMAISGGSFVDCYGPNENILASSNYSITPTMKLTRANMENNVDIIVTNFFIDTSANILDYIQTIVHVLKNQGYWINYGPLLYNFESDDQVDTTYEVDPFTGEKSNIQNNVPLKGLELGVNQIIDIATTKFGFQVVELEKNLTSGYGSAPHSSALPGYKCHFWVMKLIK